MLFRLLAVSILMMAFVNEAFGTTTTTTTTCNCTTAMDSLVTCFTQLTQKRHLTAFNNHMAIMNTTKALKTLTKLKKKCFSKPASLWNEVKCWIALNEPPPCLANIYQSLTEAQKRAVQKAYNKPDDEALANEAAPVWTVIDDQYDRLSDTDKQIIDDWNSNYMTTCGFDYYNY